VSALVNPAAWADHSANAYRLVNGNVVANSWGDLANGDLTHAIDVNEIGQAVTASVWTKTTGSGAYVTVGDNCTGFTSTTGTGQVGSSSSTTSTWYESSAAQSCSATNIALYCVEQ
jgi:hypothetical protein